MRDFFKLPRNRRVDFRVIMSMQICPDGRIGVEIFTAFHVAQHRAFAGRDDNRLASQPVTHLCKWMPDKFAVELGELVHAFKVFNAAFNPSTSLAVCAAVKVTRKRAAPRATVG